MREFIIPATPPVSDSQTPAPTGPKPPEPAPVVILPERIEEPRKKAPSRGRDFIIVYRGEFIGHYRASRPITPRVAHAHVARELRMLRPDFAPEALDLYRPVKLRLRRPLAAGAAAGEGAFSWFQGEKPSP